MKHIRYFIQCQRNPQAYRYLEWFKGHRRAIWLDRRYVPILDPLARCVISHESGGRWWAVNGQYEGIGQWSPSRWLSDGGGRYSSTPLGATYNEQATILMGEGDAGMREQQAQYDGC